MPRNREFIKACSYSKPSEITLLTGTNPMSETEFALDHEREFSTPPGSTSTTSEIVPCQGSRLGIMIKTYQAAEAWIPRYLRGKNKSAIHLVGKYLVGKKFGHSVIFCVQSPYN